AQRVGEAGEGRGVVKAWLDALIARPRIAHSVSGEIWLGSRGGNPAAGDNTDSRWAPAILAPRPSAPKGGLRHRHIPERPTRRFYSRRSHGTQAPRAVRGHDRTGV